MLDWWLAFAEQWITGVQQATAQVTVNVMVTAIATLDISGRLASQVAWYIANPYVQAGPALPTAGLVAVVQAALVAQEPASITLSANVVRGVEYVLTRTETNAALVDWAVTRTTSGTVAAVSDMAGHGNVDDIDALNFLLGVHL